MIYIFPHYEYIPNYSLNFFLLSQLFLKNLSSGNAKRSVLVGYRVTASLLVSRPPSLKGSSCHDSSQNHSNDSNVVHSYKYASSSNHEEAHLTAVGTSMQPVIPALFLDSPILSGDYSTHKNHMHILCMFVSCHWLTEMASSSASNLFLKPEQLQLYATFGKGKTCFCGFW